MCCVPLLALPFPNLDIPPGNEKWPPVNVEEMRRKGNINGKAEGKEGVVGLGKKDGAKAVGKPSD
jgi:hypothetical protein